MARACMDALLHMLVQERAKVAYLLAHMDLTEEVFDSPDVEREMMAYRALSRRPVFDRFGRRFG